MKIVKVIACAIGFGVLGAGIGLLAWINEAADVVLKAGILGAALGVYVGYRITRSKDK